MKKLLLAATLIAFGVSPVLAQSSGSKADAGKSSSTTSSDSNMSSGNGSKTISAADMAASQKKVLKALQKAGYTDTSVMDAAYMVKAKTPDGESVIMMIDTSGRVMGARKAPEKGANSSSTDTKNSKSASGSKTSN